MDSCNEYEYVLPTEFGKLLPRQFSPSRSMPPESCQTLGRNRAIHLRFRELGLPEISRHRLNILRNLGEGTFGTVFVGELEKCGPADRRLVVVKRMLRNASEKDKLDFIEEIRLLSALKDPNVTQVLGVSSEEDPCSVILEFLELGDLCQFLRQKDTTHPTYTEKLSLGDLLFMAGQIASGMKYFESRNIVHRDLAARNCVVGRGLIVKISHFASDMDVYASDYYRLDGKTPFPVRWMAWESIFLGKFSTKSDVWAFGTLFWEMLCYCRHSPYHALTNQDVVANLQRLSIDEEIDFFEYLEKPPNCPRDIYQLLCDTWCRNDEERPTFWEIHCFLSRKNPSFCTELLNRTMPAYMETHAPQYIV
ncbi:Discoidin domain-containing receptor 2 [Orchesella cincta]|uniref:Tyrosine-protein kinase receptor n=1 Tax=Orchesella cincta TaxID=48709 RepID=A0A1D2MV38_ORCCI|nr:Discoidin domain-containing receptor 2 [Orchesella cincta]